MVSKVRGTFLSRRTQKINLNETVGYRNGASAKIIVNMKVIQGSLKEFGVQSTHGGAYVHVKDARKSKPGNREVPRCDARMHRER